MSLNDAKALAARGWHIFPVRAVFDAGKPTARCDCLIPQCPNAGKHPRVKWAQETTSPEMWKKWPNDGVGIATGKRSGIWVLDVDPGNGGAATLAKLEADFAQLPETATVTTGSNGTHFYFRYPGPEFRNTAGRLGGGLDTRGDGGFVVAPGSLHRSGRRYAWRRDVPIAPAPAWLLELVRQERRDTVDAAAAAQRRSEFIKPATVEECTSAAWRLSWLIHRSGVSQWMRASADDVSREVWRGVATNLAALALGVVASPQQQRLVDFARKGWHHLSEPYSGYNHHEAEGVFNDSVLVAATHGPMSFEWMLRNDMPAELIFPSNATNFAHAAELMRRAAKTGK